MKRKFLSFVLVLASVLTAAVCLTACENVKKCFYTVQAAPEHCNVNLRSVNTTKDGQYYAKAGEENGVSVYVDDGYYSDDFKIFFNSQEVTPTTDIRSESGKVYNYEYSFTPTEDFEITFSGSFKKIQRTFTLKKDTDSAFDETREPNGEIYIRFAESYGLGLPTEETAYKDFVSYVTYGRHKLLDYGDTVEFYVYSKGYKGEPYTFVTQEEGGPVYLFSEVYHEENKFGIHYTYTQSYSTATLVFGNAQFLNSTSIMTAENSSFGNLKIGSDKLIFEISEDLSTLTVTINDYNAIPQGTKATFAALKLKVNDELQDVDFTADDDGVFTVALKDPYEYYDSEEDVSRFYQLIVDLNFYTLPYFEGEQFDGISD